VLWGISRSHRVSIAKLSHQLWNTHSQNHKYYGTPATCTLCGNSPEMPNHIYCCTYPAALETRTQAANTFGDALAKKMPPSTLTALTVALACQPSESINIDHADIIIKEQELGHYSLCHGQIITDWLAAYKSAASTPATHQECLDKKARDWLVQVIRALWHYSKMLWSYRNAAHHGKLPHFSVIHTRKQLHEQASEAYRRYGADPHSIPHSRRYLFHKPMESILTYSDDFLRCWIASDKEAELTAEQCQKIYSRIQRNTLHHYFGSLMTVQQAPQEAAKKSNLFAPPFSTEYYQRRSKVQTRRVRNLKLEKQGVSRQRSRATVEARTILQCKITRGPVRSKSRHLSLPVRTLELYGFKVRTRQGRLLSLKLTVLLNVLNIVVRMCPLPRKRSTPA
jgi:hypothetical protein